MPIKIGKRIKIDESNFKVLKTLDMIGEEDNIYLNNDSEDRETDEKDLFDHLKALKGAGRVKSLYIGALSQFKNVEVVKAFPNLRCLWVHGKDILSLDGLMDLNM